MKVYLAGDSYLRKILERKTPKEIGEIYLLRTFVSKEPWFQKYYSQAKDIILDSGAFTFMSGGKAQISWEEYVERYAHFIKATGVEHFIELDIDALVGYDKVKQLRKQLIAATNKQPIPVWHKSRGKEEFLHMCEEFSYVALGGFAIRNWTKKDFKFISWFIREAHKRGAKIHGLGFTYFNELKKYHFDSVDSSAWTIGNRYGGMNKYVGNGKVITIHKPVGTRVIPSSQVELAYNNFNEWLKFQRYAEEEL